MRREGGPIPGKAAPGRVLLRTTPAQRPSRQAIALLLLAGALVLLGNGFSALPKDLQEHWAVYPGKAFFLATLLLWLSRMEGLGLERLGLTGHRLFRSAGIGAGLAALVSVPVVLYFLFPIGVAGGSIDYQAMEEETVASFLVWALFQQPLGTAVFEEVLFRGGLQALAVRAFDTGRGIGATAATFMLWHIVINYRTVQETNVGDDALLAGLAQVGSAAGLLVGGLFLSVLRWRTDNLVGAIAFHWLTVVAMSYTLFALSR